MKIIKEKVINYMILVSFFIVGFFVHAIVSEYNSMKNKSIIVYKDYTKLSSSIDEHNRLHLTDFENNTIIILSDSVTLGIHAQISNIIYNDYMNQINNKLGK